MGFLDDLNDLLNDDRYVRDSLRRERERLGRERERLYQERRRLLGRRSDTEILEIDSDPWEMSILEKGFVRVGSRYYLVEIHEDLFDKRRKAHIWPARADGCKNGKKRKIRCGSVSAAVRALVAEQ